MFFFSVVSRERECVFGISNSRFFSLTRAAKLDLYKIGFVYTPLTPEIVITSYIWLWTLLFKPLISVSVCECNKPKMNFTNNFYTIRLLNYQYWVPVKISVLFMKHKKMHQISCICKFKAFHHHFLPTIASLD